MDSMPCPICSECQWDVDDCIKVEEALEISLRTELDMLRGLCKDVYFDYHISELRVVSEAVKKVWEEGQKLYPRPFRGEK